MERDDHSLKIEIDGPGVSPATLDALKILELGRAYFRLLDNVARASETRLELRGLAIEDKCAALVSTPVNFKLAQRVVASADSYLNGISLAPAGLKTSVNEVLKAVRALPSNQSVKILMADQSHLVKRDNEATSAAQVARTKLRVMLLRVGGDPKNPSARFESKSEESGFSATVDIPKAQALGKFLYRQLDAELFVTRDSEGLIETAELLSFEPLDEDNEFERWKKWFASAGAQDWNAVDDIERELGRTHEASLDG